MSALPGNRIRPTNREHIALQSCTASSHPDARKPFPALLPGNETGLTHGRVYGDHVFRPALDGANNPVDLLFSPKRCHRFVAAFAEKDRPASMHQQV